MPRLSRAGQDTARLLAVGLAVAVVLYFVTGSPAPCGVFVLIIPAAVATVAAIDRNVH